MPSGRLSIESRKFKQVVSDMRHVVYTVVRDRPDSVTGGFFSTAMGTGFFVSRNIFVTCDHVMNPSLSPHVAGDSYRLIANITGNSATVHSSKMVEVGRDLILYPNLDLAVLILDSPDDQPFAALSYGEVSIGEELGIVGYPLAKLITDATGALRVEGLIYRAAKGAVTSLLKGTLNPNAPDLPVIEVNFMFVSGNSGGPAFEAETGRVIGMVQGISWAPVAENICKTDIQQLPIGVSEFYISRIFAIYSQAIKLDCFRAALEGIGVRA